MLAQMKAYARVLGLRHGRFVEFEFSLNDDDLMVELIMPLPAFEEFCRRYDAVVRDDGILRDPAGTPGRSAGLHRPPAPAPAPIPAGNPR
ncbi:phenol hydroxylase subunit [Azospirillum halopraeferens]|uniref:phenol hydroxylase subunit n=1 Tax=Azospirillum halopraeferens TaxID=34010 RepID=UPI0004093E15|nr:phenol hydroxylase subunit [Azospirillum halopraeferens]